MNDLIQKYLCSERSNNQIPIHSFKNRYQLISNLGNGSFGTVDLARFHIKKKSLLKENLFKKGSLLDPLIDSQINGSNLIAIKTMKTRLTSTEDYNKVKEVKFILSVSSHPCLVQIYEIFIDSLNHQLHICMEYMNQNLYQLMKSRKNTLFSSFTLKSILSQILSAICHIHKSNYFHRDVKPENILIIPTSQYYGSNELIPYYRKRDNFVVKLADYGLARNINDIKPYTDYVSTRWYRSPEILLKRKNYSKSIDIWAFGTVAYEIAKFSPLFPGSNEKDQLWKIIQILGSPIKNNSNSSIPLGGYWNESQKLAKNLGFKFPNESGIKSDDNFFSSIDSKLTQVIISCLKWNPDMRPTVKNIFSMPYFKNTSIDSKFMSSKHYSCVNFLDSENKNKNEVEIRTLCENKSIIKSKTRNKNLNQNKINLYQKNFSNKKKNESTHLFKFPTLSREPELIKSISKKI